MTLTEIITGLELDFDAAAQEQKSAYRAYDRSRSKKNTARLAAAMEAFEDALAALKLAQSHSEAEDRVARAAEAFAAASDSTRPYWDSPADPQLSMF